MTDRLLYVDRYICYEEVILESEADYRVCVHWNQPYMNNAHTILLFFEGEWQTVVEGSHYQFAPVDLCLVKCMESCMVQPMCYPCRMQRISFSPFYFRVIDPQTVLCRPFDDRAFGVGNRVGAEEYDKDRFLANLQRVPAASSPDTKRLALVVALIEFLYELSFHYDPSRAVDHRSEEVRTILEYINAHYCEDIELATLTKNLYVSRSQLAKIMKKATGFTTWDYILNKRVFHAMQLIHKGMSTHEVATAVGFRDYSTFYKAFQKIVFTPPNNERPNEHMDPLLEHFYEREDAADWIRKYRQLDFNA